MSLINQMLQDLEARRSDAAGADSYGQQIRAVPDKRRVHPAWWMSGGLALVSTGLLAWVLLRPAAPAAVPLVLNPPLKFDPDLSQVPSPVAAPQALPEAAEAHEKAADERTAVRPREIEAAQPVLLSPAVVAATERQPVAAQPAPIPPARAGSGVVVSAPPVHEVQAATMQDTDKTTATVKGKQLSAVPSESASASASPKHVKELTPQQLAENEYRKALVPMQQGKMQEAIKGLQQALQIDPRHVGARQVLIGALLDEKRQDEALQWAREGLQLDVAQPELAMILARLQVDRGELTAAIDTLERTLPYGAERGDYQAFLAALLQRDENHKQAIAHYLLALQKAPQNGIWWMGLGISLQASRRLPEAQEAFQRAKATNALSPELLTFVESRLAQLRR